MPQPERRRGRGNLMPAEVAARPPPSSRNTDASLRGRLRHANSSVGFADFGLAGGQGALLAPERAMLRPPV
eukprot:15433551-Alexandrium_andersonii.AAC.1